MKGIYFLKFVIKSLLFISVILFVHTMIQTNDLLRPRNNLKPPYFDSDERVETDFNNKFINEENDPDDVIIKQVTRTQEQIERNQKFWSSLVKRYWELKRRSDGEIQTSNFSDIFINNPEFSLWGFNTLYKNHNFISPSNFVDTDRIIPQLIFMMEGFNHKSLENVKMKKILLYDSFKWWNYKSDFSKQCFGWGSKCQFLDHKDKHQDIDAVVSVKDAFHTTDLKVKDSVKRFLFLLESPYVAKSVLERTNDLLSTFWRESDVVTPYEKWVYYDSNVKRIHQDINYSKGKTKLAAIFVSNCGATNGRMILVRQLQQYMNVDIFGRCGTQKCPRQEANSCFEMLKRDYKFYLSFENSNCRDYITEKFFVNALKNNIVPVVLGGHPDDYAAAAPANSYIHVENFNSTKELGEYIKKLDSNDEEYAKYFEWKGTGEFIDTKYLCRVCAMVHYSDLVPPPKRKYKLILNGSSMDFCLKSKKKYWWR